MTLVHNLPTVAGPSEQEAALTYKVSTNAATLCGDIVKATATKIQGKRYVGVDGWLAIAAAHGCLVSIRDVEQMEGGVRAIGELRRMSDQALLATAEGFVGDDEPMWAKRPLFARRAMAQTRAASRVCRSAFAFVVVLIDKDLGTTPAEEMHGVEDTGGHVGSWSDKTSSVDVADRALLANAPKFTAGQLTRMKKWLEGATGTLKLTGHTAESLSQFRLDNATKLEWLEANMPEEFAALEEVYTDALDSARARMPANPMMAG